MDLRNLISILHIPKPSSSNTEHDVCVFLFEILIRFIFDLLKILFIDTFFIGLNSVRFIGEVDKSEYESEGTKRKGSG